MAAITSPSCSHGRACHHFRSSAIYVPICYDTPLVIKLCVGCCRPFFVVGHNGNPTNIPGDSHDDTLTCIEVP